MSKYNLSLCCFLPPLCPLLTVWQVLREITNKKASPAIRIKGNTIEERLDCWFKHFSNLRGKPEQNTRTDDPFFKHKVVDILPIKTGPFSMEELQKCL